MNKHEFLPKMPNKSDLELVFDSSFHDVQPYLFKVSDYWVLKCLDLRIIPQGTVDNLFTSTKCSGSPNCIVKRCACFDPRHFPY